VTVAQLGIPDEAIRRFLGSMAMDLDVASYAGWGDLLRYMDGSAAVIGEMMLPVLEPLDHAAAFQRARDLGLAFQLTNFLRDVGEDLERERVSSGWRPAGWKLGFTNQALWSRLGLDSPIRARVYHETLCGNELNGADLVQPRIEPEIVVGFGADVARMSDSDAIADAVEWVATGLEVVQCHFEHWEMTPAEAVADAGVHAALAIGPRTRVNADVVWSLGAATCELLLDDVLSATGSGIDVLGGPLDALHWLLKGLPDGLRAGEIVTTGTLTHAMPLQPGQRWEHRLHASIELEPIQLRIR
jgi:2-oxo-3-hexenedioate decarboxylase